MSKQTVTVKQMPDVMTELQERSEAVEKIIEEAETSAESQTSVRAINNIRAMLRKELLIDEAKRQSVRDGLISAADQYEADYKEVKQKYWDAHHKLNKIETDLKNKIITGKKVALAKYYAAYAASKGVKAIEFESAGIEVTLEESRSSLEKKARKFIDGVAADVSKAKSKQKPYTFDVLGGLAVCRIKDKLTAMFSRK